MLTRLYTALSRSWPWFRKTSRRLMYQFMAGYYQDGDWTFMNYGYGTLDTAPEIDAAQSAAQNTALGVAAIPLDQADEPNRYCIQLYHHVASAVDLHGRRVLEVGSGRGGGADYVKRYLGPETLVGLDFAPKAVNLCQRHYCQEGLTFIAGDAEALPFERDSFDAVINVESAHCYHSMERFLAQVRRVLRPGGHFLFADFRPQGQLDLLEGQLQRSRLQVLEQTDITPNVIQALGADHARRVAHIQRGAPRLIARLVEQFAGAKGTQIYEQFRRREVVYQSFVLQKI